MDIPSEKAGHLLLLHLLVDNKQWKHSKTEPPKSLILRTLPAQFRFIAFPAFCFQNWRPS